VSGQDVTPSVAAALGTAAIPLTKIGPGRHERLTEAERELYFWILRRFASDGRPAAADARLAAESFGLDAGRAFRTLAREDLVHLGEDGEIVVAYPFSGRPTEHVVRFERGHEVNAMCAIDALGIAPMLDESIEIVSRDPLSGTRIRIELTPAGLGTWQPAEAVVVCGAAGGDASCCSCCPVLNFFDSSESGEQWLTTRPDIRGCVISMAEAIEAGRAVFGNELLATNRKSKLPSPA
jgi:hypothetical protein